MPSPPLAPTSDQTLHFVLCAFGPFGTAYVETDPAQADEQTVIQDIATGEHERPLRVIACYPAEGWCRDVSVQIAERVAEVDDLTSGARAFAEMHGVRLRAEGRERPGDAAQASGRSTFWVWGRLRPNRPDDPA